MGSQPSTEMNTFFTWPLTASKPDFVACFIVNDYDRYQSCAVDECNYFIIVNDYHDLRQTFEYTISQIDGNYEHDIDFQSLSRGLKDAKKVPIEIVCFLACQIFDNAQKEFSLPSSAFGSRSFLLQLRLSLFRCLNTDPTSTSILGSFTSTRRAPLWRVSHLSTCVPWWSYRVFTYVVILFLAISAGIPTASIVGLHRGLLLFSVGHHYT